MKYLRRLWGWIVQAKQPERPWSADEVAEWRHHMETDDPAAEPPPLEDD